MHNKNNFFKLLSAEFAACSKPSRITNHHERPYSRMQKQVFTTCINLTFDLGFVKKILDLF